MTRSTLTAESVTHETFNWPGSVSSRYVRVAVSCMTGSGWLVEVEPFEHTLPVRGRLEHVGQHATVVEIVAQPLQNGDELIECFGDVRRVGRGDVAPDGGGAAGEARGVAQTTAGKGDGRISLADAQRLIGAVTDGGRYTDVEKETMAYIRENYKFTDEADSWFREEIRRFAARA